EGGLRVEEKLGGGHHHVVIDVAFDRDVGGCALLAVCLNEIGDDQLEQTLEVLEVGGEHDAALAFAGCAKESREQFEHGSGSAWNGAPLEGDHDQVAAFAELAAQFHYAHDIYLLPGDGAPAGKLGDAEALGVDTEGGYGVDEE